MGERENKKLGMHAFVTLCLAKSHSDRFPGLRCCAVL